MYICMTMYIMWLITWQTYFDRYFDWQMFDQLIICTYHQSGGLLLKLVLCNYDNCMIETWGIVFLENITLISCICSVRWSFPSVFILANNNIIYNLHHEQIVIGILFYVLFNDFLNKKKTIWTSSYFFQAIFVKIFVNL